MALSMRLLNLLLTILAARRPSTEKPISPNLIKNVVWILGLAIASGIMGAALLLGLLVTIYIVLVYHDVEPLYASIVVAILGITCLSFILAELRYRLSRIWNVDLNSSERTSLLSQVVTAPEAFLQGLLGKPKSPGQDFFK